MNKLKFNFFFITLFNFSCNSESRNKNMVSHLQEFTDKQTNKL